MIRTLFVSLTLFLLGFSIIYLTCDFPLILNRNKKEMLSVGDASLSHFNPLEKIDFSKGSFSAYLLFEKVDINELPDCMAKQKLFSTEDSYLLQQLKDNFKLIKTEGDMATCESEIFIYQDTKLVFHTFLVLTDHLVGIQSEFVGWAIAEDRKKLTDIFRRFKPVNKIFFRLE